MIELPFDSQSFPNCLFREAFCQCFPQPSDDISQHRTKGKTEYQTINTKASAEAETTNIKKANSMRYKIFIQSIGL